MGTSAYEVEITENVAKAAVKATFSVQSATTSNNRPLIGGSCSSQQAYEGTKVHGRLCLRLEYLRLTGLGWTCTGKRHSCGLSDPMQNSRNGRSRNRKCRIAHR